jgi:hypothetical protein
VRRETFYDQRRGITIHGENNETHRFAEEDYVGPLADGEDGGDGDVSGRTTHGNETMKSKPKCNKQNQSLGKEEEEEEEEEIREPLSPAELRTKRLAALGHAMSGSRS